MRIAITTWHSGPNAGTFLQLYGLYHYLTKRGHHVEVIDYIQKDKRDMYPRGWYYYFSQPLPIIKRKNQRAKYNNLLAKSTLPFIKEISNRDKRFIDEYVKMSFTKPISTDDDFAKLNELFDVFIVGSDQIWNSSMLNRRYFLNYVHSDKIKASYAPSMGSGTVLSFQRKIFRRELMSFNYVSTREKKLANILNLELNRKVEHVLDPSMLVSVEEYMQFAHLPEQFQPNTYLLCYFMPNNEKQRIQVIEYAKKHNLKIVIMALHASDYLFEEAEIYAEAGPREFVGLIANAAAVFTSSFHCTIFSILFNKDFYVFQAKASSKTSDTNQRFNEQLQTYGINRLIKWESELSEDIEKPIDYNKVNKIFKARLETSKNYLNQFV